MGQVKIETRNPDGNRYENKEKYVGKAFRDNLKKLDNSDLMIIQSEMRTEFQKQVARRSKRNRALHSRIPMDTEKNET